MLHAAPYFLFNPTRIIALTRSLLRIYIYIYMYNAQVRPKPSRNHIIHIYIYIYIHVVSGSAKKTASYVFWLLLCKTRNLTYSSQCIPATTIVGNQVCSFLFLLLLKGSSLGYLCKWIHGAWFLTSFQCLCQARPSRSAVAIHPGGLSHVLNLTSQRHNRRGVGGKPNMEQARKKKNMGHCCWRQDA